MTWTSVGVMSGVIGVLFTIMSTALVALIRDIVRRTKVDNRLDAHAAAIAELSKDLRTIAEAMDKRVRYLEEHIWSTRGSTK